MIQFGCRYAHYKTKLAEIAHLVSHWEMRLGTRGASDLDKSFNIFSSFNWNRKCYLLFEIFLVIFFLFNF